MPSEFKKIDEAKDEKQDTVLLKENHGDEIKDVEAENSFIQETNMVEREDAGSITEQDLIEQFTRDQHMANSLGTSISLS